MERVKDAESLNYETIIPRRFLLNLENNTRVVQNLKLTGITLEVRLLWDKVSKIGRGETVQARPSLK